MNFTVLSSDLINVDFIEYDKFMEWALSFTYIIGFVVTILSVFRINVYSSEKKVEKLINDSHVLEDNHELHHENLEENCRVKELNDPRLKVLVVDPSFESRSRIKRVVNEMGCAAITAISGIEGLILLKTGDFDTAFVNIDSLSSDGITCVDKYRHWLKNVIFNGVSHDRKVVKSTLLVGMIDTTSCTQSYTESIDVYVNSPLTPSTLNALVFPAYNLLPRNSSRNAAIIGNHVVDGNDEFEFEDFETIRRRNRKRNEVLNNFSCFTPHCECNPNLE